MTKLREFKIPDEPTDIKRVEAMDGTGTQFRYDPQPNRWIGDWIDDADAIRYDWDDLIRDFGGVVEVPVTRYDLAVEFFKGSSVTPSTRIATSLVAEAHAGAIVDKHMEDLNA